MLNPMDFVPMRQVPGASNNIYDIIQQAKQNPQALEEYLKQANPQGYNQALQIRNSTNPQAIIMNMARQRGINPSILQMLGIG